ncbi:MAG: hypothetical protein IKQ41_06180 [Clostridia bacterium]|nr:hypothetical protein [Clostridia bacterium]
MIYSYCKRCKMESPGDTCPGCGKRSTAAAQRDVWSIANVPLSDGRAWRGALYTLLGVSVLLLAVILGLEALLRDAAAAMRLLQGALPRLIAALAAIGLALVFLFLALQGREVNVYVLDPQGAHLQTWHGPQKWKSWARLQSADPGKNVLQQDGSVMHLSQERHMMWRDVQSVQYKPARAAIFVYHTPHCAPMILKLPAEEFDLAAAYVGKYCKGK